MYLVPPRLAMRKGVCVRVCVCVWQIRREQGTQTATTARR